MKILQLYELDELLVKKDEIPLYFDLSLTDDEVDVFLDEALDDDDMQYDIVFVLIRQTTVHYNEIIEVIVLANRLVQIGQLLLQDDDEPEVDDEMQEGMGLLHQQENDEIESHLILVELLYITERDDDEEFLILDADIIMPDEVDECDDEVIEYDVDADVQSLDVIEVDGVLDDEDFHIVDTLEL